jgi:hypothetical protein
VGFGLRQVDEYFAWAAEDGMLVGMAPWHYANRPSSMATSLGGSRDASSLRAPSRRRARNWNPSMDHGAVQYPGFVAHLLKLGWRNVSQLMPADWCGLV